MKKIPPNTPKIGNGPILLIRVAKSIQLKWVNVGFYLGLVARKRLQASDQVRLRPVYLAT